MNTGNAPAAIRVALADDHRMLREGLRRLLESSTGLQVVAEAADGDELLSALQAVPADVAVVDLTMPGLSGMELIRRLKTIHPGLAVLVLTMHAEEQYALRAFRHGATGYLTKDHAGAELVLAIRKVAAGGGYVSATLAERLAVGLAAAPGRPSHAALTDREFEVLRHIVAGRRLTEIGELLDLSIKTVSSHKARILDKLGLDSTAALVRYGLQHQLLDDPGARP